MEKKTAVLTVLGVLSLAASFAATGPAARPPATPAGQAPPGEFEPMKGMPMFGAPLIFNCAKDGRIFLLNPHKYEVSVFKDRKLESTLAGQSELFKPLQKMGRGIVSTAAHVVASGDLVLVSFQNPDPRAKKTADIFQAGKQVGSVDIPGTPYNVDAQGRIYFAETDPFPRVVRYVLEKQ